MSQFERFSQSKPNLIHYGWIEKKKPNPIHMDQVGVGPMN